MFAHFVENHWQATPLIMSAVAFIVMVITLLITFGVLVIMVEFGSHLT